MQVLVCVDYLKYAVLSKQELSSIVLFYRIVDQDLIESICIHVLMAVVSTSQEE